MLYLIVIRSGAVELELFHKGIYMRRHLGDFILTQNHFDRFNMCNILYKVKSQKL